MEPYEWTLSKQGTERFLRCRRPDRVRLLDRFDYLAAHVEIAPEAKFKDASGKEFNLTTVGNLVITYYVDHAVLTVFIIAIE